MAGQPFDMLSDELVRFHIDAFIDAAGDEQQVDAIEWRSSDPSIFTAVVSADGRDAQAVAVAMTQDQPSHGATMELHVTENGVADAIVETFAGTVRTALSSPPAVGVRVTVGAPEKQTP
jgi:hypothetical protein